MHQRMHGRSRLTPSVDGFVKPYHEPALTPKYLAPTAFVVRPHRQRWGLVLHWTPFYKQAIGRACRRTASIINAAPSPCQQPPEWLMLY